MKYLLDTNILVAALRSRRGASHELMRRVLQGKLPIVMHHKLLVEYRDVLSRPDILDGFIFSVDEIEKILARNEETMPTIKNIPGPYRLFFYSFDCGEPKHIHVQREKLLCKYWLEPLSMTKSCGFSAKELNQTQSEHP
jgi:hypothetical protein